MNKIQAILSKLQPVAKAAGQDIGGVASAVAPNVGRELGTLVDDARWATRNSATNTANRLRGRAENKILESINMNPSASLRRTMDEISDQTGITNNLDLVKRLYEGGNVSDLQVLGLGAGEAVARAVAARPGAALATAGGTGAVGGLALITASGQALADLGNFLAGGQQSQDNRDNVLRS